MSGDVPEDPTDARTGPQSDSAHLLTGILLAGLTASEAVRCLRLWFGDEAIKSAIKSQAGPKRGRPKFDDWPALRSEYEADARVWLDGRDPFAERSNYKVANDLAKTLRGQSYKSTQERLETKMAATPYNRKWWAIVLATEISRKEYPYATHLRALEARDGLFGEGHPHGLPSAHATLASYLACFGSLPPPETTFREIEDALSTKAIEGHLPASR